MKLNYVCPCWSGWRRGGADLYNADRSLYLRVQLMRLWELRHNLAQITLCIPKNLEEPPEFRAFLNEWPAQIRQTPVVVMETENTGASYGPYQWVFERYRDAFDAYILVEDDYVFVKDDFDRILEKYLSDTSVGYWCGRVEPALASVSNGVVPAWAFQQVWDKYGHIPHRDQETFSKAFHEAGVKMKDFGNKYRMPFYSYGVCAWYYHTNNADLLVPVQLYLDPRNFREVFLPSSWPEWRGQVLPCEIFADHRLYYERLTGIIEGANNAPAHGL